MRVCILTSSFPRFRRDTAGVFIYHLARHLAKIGMEIDIIAPHDDGYPYREQWDNITIHRFQYAYPPQSQNLCYRSGMLSNMTKDRVLTRMQIPMFFMSQAIELAKRIHRKKPDIIHAHWSLPQGLIGVSAQKIFGIPCVVSVHGSDVFGLNHPIARHINAFVLKHAAGCTANSTATRNRANILSQRHDIAVIPMGIDTRLFCKSPDTETIRQEYGIVGKKIMLSVGRLIEIKGLNYLVNAMNHVLRKEQDAVLILIGSGPEKNRLICLAQQLGIEGHIRFIDAMPQEKLVKFYSLADVFVMPSVVSEGLGLVLLEASSCGATLIGTDIGGIRDIIRHEHTGLLVPPKDSETLASAILRVLQNKSFGEKLASNAKNMVKEQFSWKAIAEKFAAMYRHARCA